MSKNFTHVLAGRSYFSLGESLLSPAELVEKAHVAEARSVALTDTMTISGLVEFTKKAKELGVKPILGCRLRVVEDLDYRPPKKTALELPKFNPEWYPKVFVKNEAGYRDLLELLTLANQSDHFYYTARLSIADLLSVFARGNLVVSTGDLFSLFAVASFSSYSYDVIAQFKTASQNVSDFVLELCPIEALAFDTYNSKAIEAALKFDLGLIVTYPTLYVEAKDADSRDVLAAIIANHKMSDEWRHVPYCRDFAVTPPIEDRRKQLIDLIHRLKEQGRLRIDGKILYERALIGNLNLAEMCDFVWDRQAPTLPKMAENELKALMDLVALGWRQRLFKPILGYKPDSQELLRYKERLRYELDILRKMGFERYFLLVYDIVTWAKQNGISVGPGRGSVGGSLVAYLLGITDVDPLRFNLFFERFINPDRIDLPDADLDFMSTRRDEVLKYIESRFGKDNVAGISNYVALGSSSVIRDVSRVHELPTDKYECSKYVVKEHGQALPLEEQVALVPEIEKFKDAYPELWTHATILEGCMRNLGKHAAGIVVAGESLANRAVVETRAETPVINWDKNAAEDMGLVKMDILGLSTLDVLTLANDYIKKRWGHPIDYLAVPLDDPATLKNFAKGNTIGVFQFESSGMRRLLKDLALGGSLTFDDLSAATALYRPGPMDSGMLDDFVAIRKGFKDPEYEHPSMELALKETGGVIVYQEQVMQLARDVAGYTLAEADTLRKIMGKKKKEEMAKQRDKWVQGCKATHGMEEESAGALFDAIEKFAGYGFNKSHSVEYSIVSFWSMYVKTHYSGEFFAAALSIEDNEDKLTLLVEDAARNNVRIMPPDINISSGKFEIRDVNGETWLYAPFSKIKGFSDTSANWVVKARERPATIEIKKGKFVQLPAGPFTSIDNFEARVNKSKVTVRHRAALDKVGAFASIDPTQLPATHPDRIRDQLELLPGLAMGTVKADRRILVDAFVKQGIVDLYTEVQACKACDLCAVRHPLPYSGARPKFMVVFDSPSKIDEEQDRIFYGSRSGDSVREALKEAGLKPSDGYYTTVVKAPKPKEQKFLSNQQLNGCSGFLKRELELLKPPVIVCLGSAANRFFAPNIKGSPEELAGKVVYLPEYDASVVLGVNPAMTYFKHEAQDWLQKTFDRVADLVQ